MTLPSRTAVKRAVERQRRIGTRTGRQLLTAYICYRLAIRESRPNLMGLDEHAYVTLLDAAEETIQREGWAPRDDERPRAVTSLVENVVPINSARERSGKRQR